MAKIKVSNIIIGLSGKLGGCIFAYSPNTQYVKNNAYSQQPNSMAQLRQRYKIGLITQLWRDLNALQRSTFADEIVNYPYLDTFGTVKYLTPFALFSKLNLNRQAVSLPPLTEAPAYIESVTPSININGLSGGFLLLTVSPSGIDIMQRVYMHYSSSSSLTPPLQTFKEITLEPIIGEVLFYDITELFLLKFPEAAVNGYVFTYVRSTIISSGLTSAISNVTTSQIILI
jgi:hypothetical protein